MSGSGPRTGSSFTPAETSSSLQLVGHQDLQDSSPQSSSLGFSLEDRKLRLSYTPGGLNCWEACGLSLKMELRCLPPDEEHPPPRGRAESSPRAACSWGVGGGRRGTRLPVAFLHRPGTCLKAQKYLSHRREEARAARRDLSISADSPRDPLADLYQAPHSIDDCSIC